MNNSRHAGGIGALGIVGTGRMAQAMGAALQERGWPIAAVAGRRREATAEAARFIGVSEAVTIGELGSRVADVLVCVTDGALSEVARELAASGLQDGVALHLSAGAGPEALGALRISGNAVGVLHPCQTAPSPVHGQRSLPGSTFAFAGDPEARQRAHQLVQVLEGHPLEIEAAHWPRYHAAAVVACNYQATLVDAAMELMEEAGVNRHSALAILEPLLRASIENIVTMGPERALTGPIARGDVSTVTAHIAALQTGRPETLALYQAAGRRTLLLARRAGLSEDRLLEIERALKPQAL